MPIRYLSGLSVDSTVLVVDAANDRVGIGTASPDFKLHLVGGSQYINGGQGGISNASPYTSTNRLIFNNDYNDIARGPNKITLYDGSWLGGFGVHDNTLAYYSGGNHNWYQATTATNAISLMTLLSSGNVGIGTTSPGGKLDVVPTSQNGINIARAGGYPSLYSSNDFVFETDGVFYFGVYTPRTFIVNNGFYVTTSGNTGIGTGTPSQKLDVSGYIRATSGFVGNGGLQLWGDNTSISSGLFVATAGNVGIGTTSPTKKLDVTGDGLFSSSGSGDTLTIAHSSGSGIGIKITKGGNGEGLYVDKTSGTGNAVTIIGTLNATTLVKSGGTSSQYLMADGSVSTLTNPVTGTGTTNFVPKWTSASAIGNSAFFDGGGFGGFNSSGLNVRTFVVNAASGRPLVLEMIEFANIHSVYIRPNNSGFNLISSNYMTGGIYLPLSLSARENNADFVIGTNGNVGIGTTAPANKLEVDGGSSAVTLRVSTTNTGSGVSALVLSNSSKSAFNDGVNIAHGGGFTNITDLAGTNIMSWDLSNTRVGIGTTTPGAKLDVNGNVHISNAGGALYFNRPQGATVGAIGWRASDDSFYVGGLPGYGENAGNDVRVRGFGANLILGTAGSDRVFITPAGNVGIGTTSPISGQSTPLTLASADGFVGITLLGTAAYAHTWQLYASGDGGSNKLFGIYDRTNGAYRLVTTSSGNVGIGTTAPGTKLEITTADSATTVYPLSLTNPNNQAGDGGGAGIRFSTSSGPGGNGNEALKYSSIEAFDVNNFGSNSGLSFTVSNGYTKSKAIVINRFGGVGIGTTSPAYKLDVVGVGRLLSVGIIQASSNSDTPNIAFTNNGTSFTWGTIGGLLQGDGDGALFFNTKIGASVTEKMRITSAGNVGIGTTSPISALHILGNQFRIEDNDPTITLKRNVAGAFGGHIDWLTNDNTLGFQIANNALISAAVLEFNHSGVNRMVIKSDGNVGIGTTAPSELLEVVGNIRANVSNGGGFMLTGASASGLVRAGATGLALRTDTADRLTIDNSGAATFSSSVTATQFITGGTPSNTAGFTNSFYAEGSFPSLTLSNTGTNTGKYTLGVTNGNFGIWNNASSSYNLFISAGNVGIGTTAPSEKLHVNTATGTLASLDNGDGAIWSTLSNTKSIGLSSGTNYALGSNFTWIKLTGGASGNIIFAANNEAMRITSVGNVGIGTTSPFNKLTVGSVPASGYGLITISSDWASGTAISTGIKIGAANDTGAAGVDIRSHSNYAATSGTEMSFWTNSTGNVLSERMRITSAGNVGIGNTNPTAKLQVGAEAHPNATGIEVAAGAGGANLLALDSSTNHNWLPFTDGSNYYSAVSHTFRNELHFTDWMKITSAGNVGIGTTAPPIKLYVGTVLTGTNGNGTYASDAIAVNSSESITIGPDRRADWTLNATTATSTTFQSKLNIWSDNEDHITFGGASTHLVSAWESFKIWINNDSADAGTLHLYHTSSKTEFVRLAGSGNSWINGGNVGIGTTAPGYKLDVVGGDFRIMNTAGPILNFSDNVNQNWDIGVDATTDDFYFKNGISGVRHLTIDDGGNVSIGTTANPGSRTNIYLSEAGATPNAILRLQNTGSQYLAKMIITDGNTNDAVIGYQGGVTSATQYLGFGLGTAITQMVLNGAGNVGIGTTSPSEKLHVDGSTLVTYNNSFQSTNSIGNKAILARVSPTSGIVNYAEYATAANLNGFVIGSDDARVKGNITGDSLEFITNTSTRMTILSSGNVGINTTTPGSTLHVIGDVLIQTGALGVGVNPNATDGRIDASNDIVAFSTSDRRLKENITPIANALEKVRSLTGVEFDWKEETKKAHGHSGRDTGVIAQEVQAIMPTAVRTNNTGYLAVRYEKLIGLLIEGMKEQQAQIDELKAQINDSSR